MLHGPLAGPSVPDARDMALREMTDESASRGADDGVGVDLDYEVLGDRGSMPMVSANGTAVVLGWGRARSPLVISTGSRAERGGAEKSPRTRPRDFRVPRRRRSGRKDERGGARERRSHPCRDFLRRWSLGSKLWA